MDEPSTDRWDYCRIERVTRRVHWWSRRRAGEFAAVAGGRPVSRSAAFPIPSATDADIAAFHTLLAQLGEQGWEEWRGPRLGLGLEIFAVGYWDRTLRRRTIAAGPQGVASSDEATRGIDLPPPPALPPTILPPGAPIRPDRGSAPVPAAALPSDIRPPGNPVHRRGRR